MPTVVCFGAGRVAGPLVSYLLRQMHPLSLVVVSVVPGEAEQLCAGYRQQHLQQGSALETRVLDVDRDDQQVHELVAQADCVVALVPEPAQVKIAQACVKFATPLVTASYVSPGIRALEAAAREATIPILCEMGLDPGMDHMIAMKLIDEVRAKNGEVVSFASVCGGLPEPAAANNPIKYKFSWSPLGALRAAQRPAQYLKDGHIVTVPGEGVLSHHENAPELFKAYDLEQIPNGYSLPYAEHYKIPEATSIFRGTFRYKGFCRVVQQCVHLGLLDEATTLNAGSSWRDFLHKQVWAAEETKQLPLSGETQVFLSWLGLNADNAVVKKSQSVMASFCDLLVEKMSFAPGERDLVVMHVAVAAEYPDGSRETREALFDVMGEAHGDTIMAKTVGVTAAVGVRLLLEKRVQSVGIVTPTLDEVYRPSLELLAAEGISFDERCHATQ